MALLPSTDLNGSNQTHHQTMRKSGQNREIGPTGDVYSTLQTLYKRKTTTLIGDYLSVGQYAISDPPTQ